VACPTTLPFPPPPIRQAAAGRGAGPGLCGTDGAVRLAARQDPLVHRPPVRGPLPPPPPFPPLPVIPMGGDPWTAHQQRNQQGRGMPTPRVAPMPPPLLSQSEADEAEHRTLPKKQHLKIITDCQDAAMKGAKRAAGGGDPDPVGGGRGRGRRGGEGGGGAAPLPSDLCAPQPNVMRHRTESATAAGRWGSFAEAPPPLNGRMRMLQIRVAMTHERSGVHRHRPDGCLLQPDRGVPVDNGGKGLTAKMKNIFVRSCAHYFYQPNS